MEHTVPLFVHLSKIFRSRHIEKLKKVCFKLSVKEDAEFAYFFHNCEDLISVDECKSNSLVVFDDCVNTQQQQVIKNYFVRRGHENIS